MAYLRLLRLLHRALLEANMPIKPAKPTTNYNDGRTGKCILADPERKEKLLQDLASQVPPQVVAPANGVSFRQFTAWLANGREAIENGWENMYSIFYKEYHEIEKRNIEALMEGINAGDKWQAKAWLAERRYWKYFTSHVAIQEMQERLDQLEREQANEGSQQEISQEGTSQGRIEG